MALDFLKRRLNPFLLISTVVVLAILAALSVVYQDQLGNLLSQNQDLQDDLEQRQEEINSLEARNANLSNHLDLTEQDLQAALGQLNRTEHELQQTEQVVKQREATIARREITIASLENNITSLEETIAQKNRDISNLTSQISELDNWLETICELDYDANNLTDASETACDNWDEEYN